MKTALLLCVACAILCAPLTAFGQHARAATVISETAKMFEKAGGKGKLLATLKRGDRVTVSEQKNGWVAAVSSTAKGWVKAAQLSIDEAAPAAVLPAAKSAQAQRVKGYTDGTAEAIASAEIDTRTVASAPGQLIDADVKANETPLRRFPTETAPVLLTAPKGTALVVRDREGAWLKCDIGETTGWMPVSAVAFRGTRTRIDAAAGAADDERMDRTLQEVSDAALRASLKDAQESGRTIRASLAALDSRLRTADGSWNTDGISGSGFILSSLEKDAARLRLSTQTIERALPATESERDRGIAQAVLATNTATLQQYQLATERVRSTPRDAVITWGGNATLSIASHTRTAIYEYSAQSPNITVNGWVNLPRLGMFRGRLDRLDDIVTTRFTRTTFGIDWRLPTQTEQWTARAGMFSYSDAIAVNTYTVADVQAGWEQLGADRLAWFADVMYQNRAYSEKQPQAYDAITLHGGARRRGVDASGYEFALTDRYQSSEDMGLHFNMINAGYSSRLAANFQFNLQYEGYIPLATTGGAFLAYHRPGAELRWLSASGITDYGLRGQYRVHPDAPTLSYAQVMLFAGHREATMLGNNWDAQLLFQRNSGARNPSFAQGNLDFHSQGDLLYISGNAVARWLLPEASDSLSEHFSDLYLNPGAVLMAGPVRIDVGPYAGATLFLNTVRRSIQDNLNNFARVGLRANAMAMIGAHVNVRAWGELERSFYFVEDPYILRTRKPQRMRLGAEANAQILRQLAVFVSAQTSSINNDTGIMIPLSTGSRERDKIEDSRIAAGLRFTM
jgi:SH3-like domain-containing protein